LYSICAQYSASILFSRGGYSVRRVDERTDFGWVELRLSSTTWDILMDGLISLEDLQLEVDVRDACN